GGYTGDVFATNGLLSVDATISPLFGFGLEMEPNSFNTFDLSLTLSDGSVMTQAVHGDSGAEFFGWVGLGITGFTMSGTDSFAFGRFVEAYAQQSVPEPGTMALMGVGLLCLAAGRRRTAKGRVAG